MKPATKKRLNLYEGIDSPKKESTGRMKYNFCYKVWRKGRAIGQIAKYFKKSLPVAEAPTNLFEKPLTLREVVHLYSKYAHLLGYKKNKLSFTENFGYFVMVNHYEKQVEVIINKNKSPRLIHGVDLINPNTTYAYKIVSQLKDLVLLTDQYYNGDKSKLQYIISKKKSIENYINKWFKQLEEIDGVKPTDRLTNILTKQRLNDWKHNTH